MLSAVSSLISDVWRNAYGMGSWHVLEGTMNAEMYIKVLEQHMLPSRQCVFPPQVSLWLSGRALR